jgi:hypothetical protein
MDNAIRVSLSELHHPMERVTEGAMRVIKPKNAAHENTHDNKPEIIVIPLPLSVEGEKTPYWSTHPHIGKDSTSNLEPFPLN